MDITQLRKTIAIKMHNINSLSWLHHQNTIALEAKFMLPPLILEGEKKVSESYECI